MESKGKTVTKFDNIAESISFNDYGGGNSFGAKDGNGTIQI